MVCYYTAGEDAKRVIRGEPLNDRKMNGSEEDSSASPPAEQEGWAALLSRFWEADQEFCDDRFKLIPSVVLLPLPFLPPSKLL
jgi:hypothetical protein